MDHAAYHVIYVDTRVSQALDGERIKDCGTNRSEGAKTLYEGSREDQLPECLTSISEELDEIQSNIQSLLAVFHEGRSLKMMFFSLMLSAFGQVGSLLLDLANDQQFTYVHLELDV